MIDSKLDLKMNILLHTQVQYGIMAETDLINCAIEMFNWSKLFLGKNIHKQVVLF